MRRLTLSPVHLTLFNSQPAAIGAVIFLSTRALGRNGRVTRLTLSTEIPSGTAASGETTSDASVVVQHVVLGRDLMDSWPLHNVVTQRCQAAIATVWAHRDHPVVESYCSDVNIEFVHKASQMVKGEAQIRNLSKKLAAVRIAHKLWIKQPENILTCIATRPYPKSEVAIFFKKHKLYK